MSKNTKTINQVKKNQVKKGVGSKMELKYNSIFLKGKEEEKEKWRIKIISFGLKQNLSLEMIASLAEISVDEVKQYIKDNHLDNN